MRSPEKTYLIAVEIENAQLREKLARAKRRIARLRRLVAKLAQALAAPTNT